MTYPQVPRPPRDPAGRAVAGFGCFVFILWFLFWGTVLFVIAHFILKFW